ncbi:MAG: uroporphyrinogen synthase [Gammaproteobacteria bacterium]|jgi:uroporphyrinogen-III synthase|nr:uroporphyrinogen synthase [Gammaproteobacteria bacterium]
MNVDKIQQVVITKPAITAPPLLHRLQTLGLQPLLFPTLEIVANPEVTTYFQNFIKTPFNMALFISPTAVHYAMKLCALNPDTWPTAHFIAQGPGTAKALLQYGFSNIVTPEKDYSSEALFALSLLKNTKGQKIAIFKGKGGRGLLAPYLQQQGATVTLFDCYERRCPLPSLVLEDSIQTPKNSLFIVTSSAGLHNLALLLHFAQPMNRPDWRDCQLLLINDKMQSLARKLGHKGKIYVANNASDEAIESLLRIVL